MKKIGGVRMVTAAQRTGWQMAGMKQTGVPKTVLYRGLGSLAKPLQAGRAKMRKAARGY